MRLYRRVISKISKDSIHSLVTAGFIEVEKGKTEEAELDLAAVMVEYLNADENLTKQARDLLNKRGLTADHFLPAKRILAESENFKMGDEAIDYILTRLSEILLASKNIAEVFGNDSELRKTLRNSLEKYVLISKETDKEARDMLKNFKEGSPEWEIEYPRAIAQIKRKRGL